MATTKIAGMWIDLDAQRSNTPAERAAIFAHLQGRDRANAIADLEQALQELAQQPEQEPAKVPPVPEAPESKEGE